MEASLRALHSLHVNPTCVGRASSHGRGQTRKKETRASRQMAVHVGEGTRGAARCRVTALVAIGALVHAPRRAVLYAAAPGWCDVRAHQCRGGTGQVVGGSGR